MRVFLEKFLRLQRSGLGIGLTLGLNMKFEALIERCGYMTGNRQDVQKLLNDQQLEIVKCVASLTTNY